MRRRSSGTGRRIPEIEEVRLSALRKHPLPEDPDTVRDSDSDSSPTLENHSGNGDSLSRNFSNLGSSSSIDVDSLPKFCDDTASYSSASSWTDDQFERRATENVQRLFRAIEAHLYESEELPKECEPLREECRDWKDKFPHLWISGRSCPIVSQEKHAQDDRQRMVVDHDDVSDMEFVRVDDAFLHEEANDNHKGEYEELIAVDYGEETANLPWNSNQCSVNVDQLQWSILERLTDHIWTEAVSHSRSTFEDHFEYSSQASRIPSSSVPLDVDCLSSKTELPLPRLSTAVLMNRDCTDLEGVLTISSKALQKRKTEKGTKVSAGPSALTTQADNKSVLMQSGKVEQRERGRLLPVDNSVRSSTVRKGVPFTSTDRKQQTMLPISEQFIGAVSRNSSKSKGRHFTLPPIESGQQLNSLVTSSFPHTVLEAIHLKDERNRRPGSRPPTYVTSANLRKPSRIPTAVDSRTLPNLDLAISALMISENRPTDSSIRSGSSKPLQRRRSSVAVASLPNNRHDNLHMSASNYFTKKRTK